MTNLPSDGNDADAAGDAARVYVGNLKPKANETHITAAFARFGAIQSVWVARKPPGFAFVAFERESDAVRAVHTYDDAHPLEILGKRVKVQLAGEKTAKQTANKAPEVPPAANKRDGPCNARQSREDHYSSRREAHRHSRSRSRNRSLERLHRQDRPSSPRRRRRSHSHSHCDSSSRSPSPHRRRMIIDNSHRHRRHRTRRGSYERSSSRSRRSRSRSVSRSRSKSPSRRHHRRS